MHNIDLFPDSYIVGDPSATWLVVFTYQKVDEEDTGLLLQSWGNVVVRTSAYVVALTATDVHRLEASAEQWFHNAVPGTVTVVNILPLGAEL